MLTVRVLRKKWYRGKEKGSMLLRKDGRMCCLGFASIAAGIPKKDIRGVGTPSEIGRAEPPGSFVYPPTLEKLVQAIGESGYVGNTGVCQSLMSTNDHARITDRQREAEIRRLGKRAGIRFIFTDKEK